MKKLKKMSLANMTGKLTRKEMSNIMAGSGNCCAVIMEINHNWQSCGLTQQEAEAAVCYYTVANGYGTVNSYWKCWS